MTTGQQLKQYLNLDRYRFPYIQKVLGIGIPIFVITIDSQYPDKWISYGRLIKMQSHRVLKVKKYAPPNPVADFKKQIAQKIIGDTIDLNILDFNKNKDVYQFGTMKLSLPIYLQDYDQSVGVNSIIIIRDISSEYFFKKQR